MFYTFSRFLLLATSVQYALTTCGRVRVMYVAVLPIALSHYLIVKPAQMTVSGMFGELKALHSFPC